MPDFVFVHTGKQEDETVKKKVRSAAATHSHRVGPRKPKKSRKFLSLHRGDEELRGSVGSFKVFPQTQGPSLPASRRGSKALAPLSIHKFKFDQSHEDGSHQLPTPAPTPLATIVGQVVDDPFALYPVPPQPFYPKLLFQLTGFMSRAWRSLPLSQDERDKAMVWVHRQTRSDPTYFLMNMLSVSVDLHDKGQIDKFVIPWLTAQVVTSLNEALKKQETALKIGTIMTVSRLTLHEIFLGDINAGQNIHRPALAKMIVMAGGVGNLNLPAIVLASWAWAERLIVQKTGVTMADLEPSLANEAVFRQGRALNEDLKVLAGYHPKREWRDGEMVLPDRPKEKRLSEA